MPPELHHSGITLSQSELSESNKKALKLAADYSNARRDFSHYFAVSCWGGWIPYFVYLTPIFPLLCKYCKVVAGLIAAPVILSAIYPTDDKYRPQWTIDFSKWMLRKSAEYFHSKIFFEDEESIKGLKQAVISLEPHDVLPVSVVLFTEHLRHFHDLVIRGCFTWTIFAVPGMRHFCTWCGATSVDKKNIQRLLKEGKSPAICPGGVQEATYLTSPDSREIVLHLSNRYGFVKLAVENGIPLIPVFAFNQREAYGYWVPQWKWLHAIRRALGFIPIWISGAFDLPFGIPRPCAISMVVGSPIPVQRATAEELAAQPQIVEDYHRQFLIALRTLFETHKAQFNMEHHILIIR